MFRFSIYSVANDGRRTQASSQIYFSKASNIIISSAAFRAQVPSQAYTWNAALQATSNVFRDSCKFWNTKWTFTSTKSFTRELEDGPSPECRPNRCAIRSKCFICFYGRHATGYHYTVCTIKDTARSLRPSWYQCNRIYSHQHRYHPPVHYNRLCSLLHIDLTWDALKRIVSTST